MTFFDPQTLRTLSMRDKFPCALPTFTPGRVSTLKDMIAAGPMPARMQQKWNGILAVDNTYVPAGPVNPWYVPQYYEDPEANAAVTTVIIADVAKAADLGLRWHILRNPADAEAVARILNAWTGISIIHSGDSRLTWSNKWPMFIQAAQLIRDSPAYTPALESAMKAQTQYGLEFSTAFIQTQNRAAWGLVYNIAAAGYLNDRDLLDRSIARWRQLFDEDIIDNIPFGETDREANGLYYCNFWMNAMTQAAELARFNGEWLYDYVGPDGSTFKGVWEVVTAWTAHPETYPYWPGSGTPRIQSHVDPLHALWPNADSQLLIDTYTTTLDNYGYRQGILAYRNRPLWG